MPKIYTMKEGHECLEAAQLIEPDDMLDIDTLAGMLVQISLFLGMSQAMRDSMCATTLLMAKPAPADAERMRSGE